MKKKSLLYGLVGAMCLSVGLGVAATGNPVVANADGEIAAAKTVKEAELTTLSNWTNVVSTAIPNEANRVSGSEVVNSSFQMMWDANALYLLVKTDDATVDNADQIEFAYHNGSANGYFLASLESAWTSDFNDKSIMNSTVLAQFDDTEGNRYILTKHIMTDTSVLGADKSLTYNVKYADFDGTNTNTKLCDYSVTTSFGPGATITLVGTPMEETLIIPNAVSARNVAESALTTLSNWEGVASKAMPCEFQRASGYDVKINASFQMMWDNNALYVLVKTDDASVHENDQREFAYTDGSANTYSQFGFSGWTDASTTGSVAAMTSTALAKFSDTEGNRYLLSKHVMADSAVLGENKQIVVNVVYRDFKTDGSLGCIYSASSAAAPTEALTLIGTPIGLTPEEQANLDAANAVETKINAISATVTEADKTAIEEARTAYDALTAAQKELVSATIYAKLTAAEETLRSINYKASAMPDWEADLSAFDYWENVAEVAVENVIVGSDTGANVTFRMIWDYESVYFLVKFGDTTVHAADQIEIGYFDGENYCYALCNYQGNYSEIKASALMNVMLLGNFEKDGFRYMVTKHTFADNTALVSGGQLILNMNYYDFADVSGVQTMVCRYSWANNGAGAPEKVMTLTGTPDVISQEEQAWLEEVEEVKALIVVLPGSISLDNEAQVLAAKSAFDVLNDWQKARISTRLLDNLTGAVKTIEDLKAAKAADEAAANDVVALIEAIGTVTLDSENAIVAARAAYNDLTGAQKALVAVEKLTALTTAESSLADLKEAKAADEAAANDVVALIEAIGTVTLDSENAIVAARTAYDALTDAQKALVSAEKLTVLTTAESSLEALKNAPKGCGSALAVYGSMGLLLIAFVPLAFIRKRNNA